MSRRRGSIVLAIVLILISLPVIFAATKAALFHRSERNTGAIVSSGRLREYLLYVPRSYDHTKPSPLVISMHAAALWPAAQMETSQWNRVAERERLIVVYPAGMDGAGPRIFHVDRGPGLMQDVTFISHMIDTLEAHYNIDPSMIYANGLSNGGGMSFVLSCTLSDRIAAVGLVASAQTLPWSWCTDQRPVPMIAFHGTADSVTRYNGGTSWISSRPFPNIPLFVANWARRNGCGPTPLESGVAPDVTRREYTNCAGDAPVVFYTIHGGGHSWPGGKPLPEWFVGTTTNGVDATNVMWTFFREHPLRSAHTAASHAQATERPDIKSPSPE